MNDYWIFDDLNICKEQFRTAKQIKTWFEGYLRNVYKDDARRLNNTKFLHIQNFIVVSYFLYRNGTFTRITKY